MATNGVNKVMLGNEVIMDITDTTATAADVQPGKIFHDVDGKSVTGACTKNSDTSGDDIAAAYVKSGVTFHNATGTQDTGTVTWHDESTTMTLGTDLPQAVQPAYYNGVSFAVDTAVIYPGVIMDGHKILGVTGTYTGSTQVQASKYIQATAWDGTSTRYDEISPDTNYDAMGKVKVGKMYYTETQTTGTNGVTRTIISLSET